MVEEEEVAEEDNEVDKEYLGAGVSDGEAPARLYAYTTAEVLANEELRARARWYLAGRIPDPADFEGPGGLGEGGRLLYPPPPF